MSITGYERDFYHDITGIRKTLMLTLQEAREANRLKKIEMRVALKGNAYRGMFKHFKDKDGIEHTITPSEEDRKKLQEEWDAIEDELDGKTK